MSGAPHLVVASASPRRHELLKSLGIEFTIAPSHVDETLDPGSLKDAVAALALRKARAVAARQRSGLVLGADTIVVVDGEALGKPSGPVEAAAMLRRLCGRAHEVMTGVGVIDAASGAASALTVTSRVTMRPYTDAEIAAYVATEEPLDKAGAYALQGLGGALVMSVEGSRSNVVGLPLEATAALLRRFGVAVSAPATD